MRSAAGDLARAARQAGYAPEELTDLLRERLLPLLRARHAGPEGEWLWDRVVAWSWAAYAPEVPAPLELGASPRPADSSDGSGSPAERGRRSAADWDGATPPPWVGLAAETSPSVYRLDAHDTITRVNTAWRAFAVENGAPALPVGIVGTSVWSHVSGTETRRLYAAVHATVRASGRPVTLPYRCDAPAERRWMTLTVRPLGRGHLQVVSALVGRAARRPVRLLDATVPRGNWPLLVCGWCSRVRPVADAVGGTSAPRPWVDVETLPVASPGASALPRLVHDVCPSCADGVRTRLASA